MNIFWLDKDLKINASFYVDAHVRKIILEITQLLSNTLYFYGSDFYGSDFIYPFKPTHLNHPLSKWVRESKDNFDITCELGIYLGLEFKYRFKKRHKCHDIITKIWEDKINLYDKLPGKDNYWLTETIDYSTFYLCMPDKYKTEDPIESYRNYYINEKNHLFKWTNRDIPYWIRENK